MARYPGFVYISPYPYIYAMYIYRRAQDIAVEAVRERGRLRPWAVTSIVAERLGLPPGKAAWLVKMLVKRGVLIYREGYLHPSGSGSQIRCRCGAVMSLRLLERTKGFCPSCHHYILT